MFTFKTKINSIISPEIFELIFSKIIDGNENVGEVLSEYYIYLKFKKNKLVAILHYIKYNEISFCLSLKRNNIF